MDIAKLRGFYVVAKRLSYRGTGVLLGCSDAAVRKQVLALEDMLGYKLVETVKHKIMLTRHGKIFLPFAENLIDQYERALGRLLDEGAKNVPIRIHTTNAIAGCWLPRLLATFESVASIPSINIIASDSDPDMEFDGVDIAIRPTIKNDSLSIKRNFLIEYQMNLYASKSYLEHFGVPQKKEDLDHHRLISFGNGVAQPYEEISWHLNLLAKKLIPYLTINSAIGILKAVEGGIGIAPLSEVAVSLSETSLVRVLPGLSGPSVQVQYFVHPAVAHSTNVEQLFNHLRLGLRDPKWHFRGKETKTEAQMLSL